MLAILVAGSFMRKIPVAVLLVVASIAGAVVGGMTDPLLKRDYFTSIASIFVGNSETVPSLLRHFMEGSMLFLNLMLTVAAGMLFMSILKENGALNLLTREIVGGFHKSPTLLLILIMILIMLPAMLTGSAPRRSSAPACSCCPFFWRSASRAMTPRRSSLSAHCSAWWRRPSMCPLC